jgi:hypothetical protein
MIHKHNNRKSPRTAAARELSPINLFFFNIVYSTDPFA